MEEVLLQSRNILAQHYESEWTMKKGVFIAGETIQSTPFAPIPSISLEFCWEVCSRASVSSTGNVATVNFMLILEKTAGFNIPSSLNMKVDVKLKVGRITLIENKNKEITIYVQNKTHIEFINSTFECFDHKLCSTRAPCHYYKMKENRLTINANFTIFGHLGSTLKYCRQMRDLQILEYFKEDFDAIYNHDSLSDLTIIVDGKNLHVHKAILMAHSPVMKRMLEQDFVESKTNTLTIDDIKYEIFDHFLKALYSGKVGDQQFSTVKQLYILASKYDVLYLQLQCADILKSQLSLDNLCEIIKLAYDYNIRDNELKDKAKQFAANHFTELGCRLEWKEFYSSCPQIVFDVVAIACPKLA